MTQIARKHTKLGFTIVELSVVMAVLGLLAMLVIFSIGSWRTSVATNAVVNDLNNAKAAMESARNFGSGYPLTLPTNFTPSSDVTLTYVSGNATSFCLDAVSNSQSTVKYFLAADTAGAPAEPKKGTCATGETPTGPVIAGWSQISGGPNHSCAIIESRAYCVGHNTYGELGDGTTTNKTVLTPVKVSGALSGKTVSIVGAGTDHSCALASGSVYCWGRNDFGQLGDGTTTNSADPVAVNSSGILAGKTVTALSTGSFHTCVLASAVPICWGRNLNGQIGNNTTTDATVPTGVIVSGALNGLNETAISAGDGFSCVVASGGAYCWGINSYNNLGDNSAVQRLMPVAVTATGVLSGRTVTSISAGYRHACAVASSAVFCWGNNANGQLGNNSLTASAVPVAVYTAGVLSGRTMTNISTSPNQNHTCAVGSSTAYCWGINTYGQLGDNSVTQRQIPVAVYSAGVLSGKSITGMEVGGYANCTVVSNEAFCWGYGGYGQLMNGATANSSVPVQTVAP